jgi:hypothetical protein
VQVVRYYISDEARVLEALRRLLRAVPESALDSTVAETLPERTPVERQWLEPGEADAPRLPVAGQAPPPADGGTTKTVNGEKRVAA